MTYSESSKGIKITRLRVIQELKKHGVYDYEDFFNEEGIKALYDADKVLEWLGY